MYGVNIDVTSEKQTNATFVESQKLLEDSQRFLASILKNIPGPVYSKSANGKYLFVNEKFLEVVPVPKENITRMTDKDIFPPEIADLLMENDRLIIKEKMEKVYRETVPHPDVSTRPYDTYKFPILGENAEVVAFTGVSFDISKQVLAESKFENERSQEHSKCKACIAWRDVGWYRSRD